ncbi:phage tail tape measure protein [Ancylobacter sp. 6x-1]|uniref:Phage tail tape measure protein n=1 Tax=Ancylobacter crimeensis TaxID=2579147 RepID=A0ABT0DCS8_9HYPH|nr:phage tail tape measure protein [Ancylobacter crimeensis]MCK0197750.1 phage tail tape measure protein [Ancylobacter crimeensis]
MVRLMATLESKLIVSLIDRISAPTRAISASLGKLQAMQARNNERLDKMRGRMLDAAAAGYALYKAFAGPIQMSLEFSAKMEDTAQKTGMSKRAMDAYAASIRDVAAATGQSNMAIANGMDVLAGAGASADVAAALIGPSAKAATAYRADVNEMAQTTWALTDNLKVATTDIPRALDAMAAAGNAGKFEFADMARYFPAIGAQYAALGMTGVKAVQYLSSALQVMAKATGDNAQAATNMSNVLQKIYAPATIKAFQKQHVNLRKEMQKQIKAGKTPLEAIANITDKTLKGDLSHLGDLFEDAQVQAGIRALIMYRKEWMETRAETMRSGGQVEKDFASRMATPLAQLDGLKNALEDLGLAFGDVLGPSVGEFAKSLTPIVRSLSKFVRDNPKLVKALAFTAAGIIGINTAALAFRFAGLFAFTLFSAAPMTRAIRFPGCAATVSEKSRHGLTSAATTRQFSIAARAALGRAIVISMYKLPAAKSLSRFCGVGAARTSYRCRTGRRRPLGGAP